MGRLRQLFPEAPARNREVTDEKTIELSEDDSAAVRREYEMAQERSRELADRYTEAMTKLTQAQSELTQFQSERSVIGVRRFFDAGAKARYAELEVSWAQYSQQLSDAQRQLRELLPLMQTNNQRLNQLEERKTGLQTSIKSQKQELVEGRPELRNKLAANLAASEALFTEIQAAEHANALLSQKLAQLFQEQHELDQQRTVLAEAEETSLFHRVMPWGRSKIEQQRADLERRAKHTRRDLAHTLQRVGREKAKLDECCKQKDVLDREFFRLHDELDAADEKPR